MENELKAAQARIAELEAALYAERIDADDQRRELDAATQNLSGMRAELAALKAQEPVAHIPVDRETGEEWHPVLKKGSGNICDYKPLYAAPVVSAEQQGVADVLAMARVLADRNADACNVNREDNWAIYGQDYIDDVRAMLAAPAQSTTEGQGDE